MKSMLEAESYVSFNNCLVYYLITLGNPRTFLETRSTVHEPKHLVHALTFVV